MAKVQARHQKCSVLGCITEHKSLFRLTHSGDLKKQWLTFIYDGNVPVNLPKWLYVCGSHFTSENFLNEGQFNAGFAHKLVIKEGAIPTVRNRAWTPGAVSAFFKASFHTAVLWRTES